MGPCLSVIKVAVDEFVVKGIESLKVNVGQFAVFDNNREDSRVASVPGGLPQSLISLQCPVWYLIPLDA